MLVSETKQYASEAGHWYTKSGEPCHQLPYKDKKRKGELRNTTLRDARELGLYPSVSAILGVVEKKGLDGWKKEQVAKAAWQSIDWSLRSDLLDDIDYNQFLSATLSTTEANMTKARDLGTEIHGAIERFLRGGGTEEDLRTEELPYSLHVEAAVAALRETGVWGQPFSAERTFASPLGYGGTVDIASLPCLGNEWIFDFKCVDRLDKKLTYDDRCAQLCAYSVGLFKEWGPTRLGNIFISTSDPGQYLIHEWSMEEKEYGAELFNASFTLWKILSRYDPLKHVPS